MSTSARNVGRAIRRRLLLAGLLTGSLVVLVRAVNLQWVEGDAWAARAADQQRAQQALPAPRGLIYDRNGVLLAANREVYRIGVAPGELTDAESVAHRLRQVLGLSESEARRAVDPRRRWVVLPGRYDARVVEELEAHAGIYFERSYERFYPLGDLAPEILGRVGADGSALSGLELELDEVLRGQDGVQVVQRDGRGDPIPGTTLVVRDPVPGHDVVLTIDSGLQEIVQEALAQAVESTGAEGGDVIIVDPRTGEILAGASRRPGGLRSWRAVTEPYEPGSTLKPFFVSALLAGGHASLTDSVYAERGQYRVGSRTVSDVSAYEWLTVEDALRVSSNIAMVKLSERIDPAEYYTVLRDFGFGSPTGVPYPSESAGVLRRPSEWSRYSAGSLAIGYELAATPLQIAMAYGALANGGVLMEPRLVLEVRAKDGRTIERYEPREVRRVVPEHVAAAVSAALEEAVASGTGREAGLGPFRVAGKTGTVRIFAAGRYESAYTASFAGFFPVVDPQLVFLIKLDRPRGEYYGGITAAPVTRTLLTAALAAHRSPLDRGAVAAVSVADDVVAATYPAVSVTPETHAADVPSVVLVDAVMRPADTGAPRPASVPDVVGMSVRDAARVLHGHGFRVRVDGAGVVTATVPPPGTTSTAGSAVTVRAGGPT